MTDLCRDFDVLIARSAQLAPEDAAKLEVHLSGCSSCRELARALEPVEESSFVSTRPESDSDEYESDLEVSPGAPLSMESLPATTRYRITGEVGRGGIGRVMSAVDQLLDRPVAVKELFSTSAAMRKRFMREALITARLQHPSIVSIYDVGHLGDRSPFYVMKLVAGHRLDEAIEEATTLAQRLALVPTVLAIADAISYAHSQRILHRDLKPSNVLVGKFGETIVIDWGLAKDLSWNDPEALDAGPYRAASLDRTVAGVVLGTPAYMAPEQAAGKPVDERADVYALGAILYHVVAGTAPHEGTTLEEVVQRVVSGDVRALMEREPGMPRDLAAIVGKAMSLDVSRRYANAQGVADDLRRFLTGQLVASHTYATRELLRRWIKRHRAAVSAGLAAFVVVAIIATIAIRNIVIARGEATESREEAQRRLVTSYVDRAGLELVNRQPARSLAYTVASAQVVGLTPQTRLLAAHAIDQLPRLHWWNAKAIGSAGFVPESHDLVVSVNEIVRWNPDTDRVIWRVPTTSPRDMELVGTDALVFARDKTLSLVKLSDGTPVADIAGSTGARYDGRIMMAPGGRWLTATTPDRIDLFDVTNRTLVASIPFANSIRETQVMADGEHVIVQGPDEVMSVLDRTGKVVSTFKAGIGNVGLADDEVVYAPPVGTNGIAHLVVADRTGKVRLDLPIGISPIYALAVDLTTKRIALGTEDGVVQVRSLVSGEASWQASLGDRAGVVLFDGDLLRVASSNTVVGFDVSSGLEVERASIPAGGISLVTSDDHARVASVVVGVGLAAWARERGELEPLVPNRAGVIDVALAPGRTAIAAGNDGNLHELRDGKVVRELGSTRGITTLERRDDGALITASGNGTIVVRDHDGRELRRFAGGVLAALSPKGRLLATATSEGTIAIWDPATGTSVRTLGTVSGHVRSIRWSRDGRRIAALATPGNVSVWDVGGRVLREIPGGNLWATTIALSNDGKWLVRSGEPADTMFALDGGNDRKLVGADRQGAALVVSFSADDKTVLVAGLGFLSTWDVETATPRLRIATDGFITAGEFFDHGAYIIAGGLDRRVHVWNAGSGAELLAFAVPGAPQKFVVDPEDSRIAVLAGRALVWTVPAFPGSLDDLHERVRCALDLEVVDAQLREHPIDVATCNRVAW